MGIYWVYPLLKAPWAGQTARVPSQVIIFNFLAVEPSCISSECLSKSLSPCHQKEAKTDRNEWVSIWNLYHFCWTCLPDLRKDRKQNPPQICDFALRGGVPSSHVGESPAFTDPMPFSRRFRSFRHLTVTDGGPDGGMEGTGQPIRCSYGSHQKNAGILLAGTEETNKSCCCWKKGREKFPKKIGTSSQQ